MSLFWCSISFLLLSLSLSAVLIVLFSSLLKIPSFSESLKIKMFQVLLSIFLLLSSALNVNALIDINCTAHSLTGIDCEYYIVKRIGEYINIEKMYSSRTPPVLSKSHLPMVVNASMGLNHMPTVSMLEGTVHITSMLNLEWRDEIINWNPKWTPGAYSTQLDSSWLWTPQLDLFNAVGLNQDMVQGNSNIIINFMGGMKWTRALSYTYICDFKLESFPFDRQNCNAKFGSFRDSGNVATFYLSPFVSAYQLNELKSPSWEINSVTAYRTVEGSQQASFLNWSVKMTRYNSYYVTTIIVPATLVTFLSLTSLWINDISSRLLLSIMTVLIITALLWSLSLSLPITNAVTWIQRFSTSCCIFIILVCLESTSAAYMTMKKGPAPFWVKYLVVISTPRKLYRFVTGTEADKSMVKKNRTDIELVEGKYSRSDISQPTQEDLEDEADDLNAPAWKYDPSDRVGLLNRKKGRDVSSTDRTSWNASEGVEDVRSPRPNITDDQLDQINWIRGARALDRMSRTLFTTAYFLYLLVIFAEISI